MTHRSRKLVAALTLAVGLGVFTACAPSPGAPSMVLAKAGADRASAEPAASVKAVILIAPDDGLTIV